MANDSWVPPKSSTRAWVIYDLANTIFYFGVIGYGIQLWAGDIGVDQPDAVIGYVRSAAGLVVAFLAPWLGSRTDFWGRRLPTLAVLTMLAVAGTALLGIGPTWFTFLVFGLALIGFNTGSAIYDALLPDVSTPATRGRVSGLGVGIGYLGSGIGLGIFFGLRLGLDRSYSLTFASIGLAFLLFSLPAFLLIRERPRRRPSGRPPRLSETVSYLVAAWRRASQYPGVVRFLIARFLYTDVLTTLTGFLTLFVTQELGFGDDLSAILIATAIGTAIPGSLVAGRLVERYGPRRVLGLALLVVAVGMVCAIVAAVADLPNLAWVIGPLGGAGWGAIPATDRVVMARISPPQHLGEFYGLYATIGRFSTILGPLLWGVIADVLDLGRNAAMGMLIGLLLIALSVLRRVDDQERVWVGDDLG